MCFLFTLVYDIRYNSIYAFGNWAQQHEIELIDKKRQAEVKIEIRATTKQVNDRV